MATKEVTWAPGTDTRREPPGGRSGRLGGASGRLPRGDGRQFQVPGPRSPGHTLSAPESPWPGSVLRPATARWCVLVSVVPAYLTRDRLSPEISSLPWVLDLIVFPGFLFSANKHAGRTCLPFPETTSLLTLTLLMGQPHSSTLAVPMSSPCVPSSLPAASHTCHTTGAPLSGITELLQCSACKLGSTILKFTPSRSKKRENLFMI